MKSDLLHCLMDLAPVNENVSGPTIQVNVLDSAAIINMLRPETVKTLQNYSIDIFNPYITSQLQYVSRLDIIWDVYVPVWDVYVPVAKKGKGVRRRVEPSSPIPGNWQEYDCINDNKPELFSFLARCVIGIGTNKQVITTYNTGVLSTNCQDVSGLSSCTHEEADTRILLHLENAVRHGNSRVSIHTVDMTLWFWLYHQPNGSTSPNCELPWCREELQVHWLP